MLKAITTHRSLTARAALAVLFALSLVAPAVTAQDEESQKPSTKAGYYLRTEDGRLVPLTDFGVSDAALEDLIRQKRVVPAPQYVLGSVKLKGDVRGGLAHLEATVTVQLTVDDRWISVPIAMDDGKLTGTPEYKGPGKHAFDRAASSKSGVRTWLFNGAGKHELKLPMVVPVRQPQHLRHSLRLRLPQAASSQISLSVSEKSILAEPPRGAGFKATPTDDGTTMEAWGLGTQFAMQWDVRPDVRDARPFLRSQTNFIANLATDPFAITAKQTLIMQQGSATTFDITLPEGLLVRESEPLRVDPTGRVKEVDADNDPGKVRITLVEPLTDKLELNWSLVPQDLEVTRRWKFNGFLVEGAQEQTTELELTPPEGVAVQEIKTVGVQKSRSARADQRVTRCRLLSPESQFVVELRDVKPFFTAAPRIVLFASREQLRLEARFRISVQRGSLQTLKLEWPGIEAQGWRILPTPAREGLVEWTNTTESDGSTELQLLARQSGTFEIGLSAVRAIDEPADLAVTLPGVSAEAIQPTTLAIATESNIEFRINEADDARMEPIPFDSRMSNDFAVDADTPATRAMLVQSEVRDFTASVITRVQSIDTRSMTAVDVKQTSIEVEQTISYQVDFGHLAELRFEIPKSIEPGFSLADGTALRRIAVGPNVSRFVLPEPMTGSFDVQIRYRLPIDGSRRAMIPIVTSMDAPFSELRLATQPDPTRATRPVGQWQPVFSRDYEAEWLALTPQTEIEVDLVSPLANIARRFSVERALVQTRVAGDGVESRISFVVRGRFEQQVLTVPDDTIISTIYWNGRTVPATEWQTKVEGDNGNVLTIQQRQSGGAGILTIDFRAPIETLSWSRELRLSTPGMPKDVPVDDVVWQVILPTGEHLSGYEQSSIPCFEWAFGGFGWARRSTREFENLDTWLREGTRREAQVVRTVAGNNYAFQQPGLQPLRLATFDQSLILLLGSGVAFLAAFAMLRIAPGRLAIVIPILGLLLAVISLRYAAALQLLAQPVCVGLLLAMLATWIDRRRARRGYGPYGMAREAQSETTSLPLDFTAAKTVVASGSGQ